MKPQQRCNQQSQPEEEGEENHHELYMYANAIFGKVWPQNGGAYRSESGFGGKLGVKGEKGGESGQCCKQKEGCKRDQSLREFAFVC